MSPSQDPNPFTLLRGTQLGTQRSGPPLNPPRLPGQATLHSAGCRYRPASQPPRLWASPWQSSLGGHPLSHKPPPPGTSEPHHCLRAVTPNAQRGLRISMMGPSQPHLHLQTSSVCTGASTCLVRTQAPRSTAGSTAASRPQSRGWHMGWGS